MSCGGVVWGGGTVSQRLARQFVTSCLVCLQRNHSLFGTVLSALQTRRPSTVAGMATGIATGLAAGVVTGVLNDAPVSGHQRSPPSSPRHSNGQAVSPRTSLSSRAPHGDDYSDRLVAPPADSKWTRCALFIPKRSNGSEVSGSKDAV